MSKNEAISVLRRLADVIEGLPDQGWDRKVEGAFPGLLGVLQLLRRLGLVAEA